MSTVLVGRVPTVGQPAPDFSLPSTSGETVTLASRRGHPVLLAFFPAAFTSVCTAEMCAFVEDYDAFATNDVEVFPISVDPVDQLAAFRDSLELHAHMLSDVGREAAEAYGVLHPDSRIAWRAYFLVDREGVLRWAHVEEHPGLRRENAEILDQIARLG